MENDFSVEEKELIINKIKQSLERVFLEERYIIFDFEFRDRPEKANQKRPEF